MTPELKVVLALLNGQRRALENTLAQSEANELRAVRDLETARENRARAQGALGIINDTIAQVTVAPPVPEPGAKAAGMAGKP